MKISIEKKISIIHDVCDIMMKEGLFEDLDKMLYLCDIFSLSKDEILSWLVGTLPAKSKLPRREYMLARAYSILSKEELIGL